MKKEETEFSEQMRENGFREISRNERPAITRESKKSRITIYLDSDIVAHFKGESTKTNEGYQTLINQALRLMVGGLLITEAARHLQSDILNDRKFLTELKEKLETV